MNSIVIKMALTLLLLLDVTLLAACPDFAGNSTIGSNAISIEPSPVWGGVDIEQEMTIHYAGSVTSISWSIRDNTTGRADKVLVSDKAAITASSGTLVVRYTFKEPGDYLINSSLFDENNPTSNNPETFAHIHISRLTIKPANLIGDTKTKYSYTATCEHPPEGNLSYKLNFGDGTGDEWVTGGTNTIQHTFAKEGDLVITTELYSDAIPGRIATASENARIIDYDLVIIVPSPPFFQGEEYTFCADVSNRELPENPLYEWNFDDGNGIIIPFSNEATHLYTEEGNYTVTVTLHDSDSTEAAILATATAEVQVEASADYLIALHEMNKFSLDFSVLRTIAGGSSGVFNWDWDSHGDVIWDGVNGSMEWEQNGHSERMTCRVSEDGTMIEQLIIRHEFGDTEWYELEIQNLPFWEDTMPDRFIVDVDDENVSTYVVYFNTYRTVGYQWTDDTRLYVRFLKE